jgi:hypothetical protein
MKYCEDCKVPSHTVGVCPKCAKALCINHYAEHMNHCAGRRESGEHSYRPVPEVFRG